LAGLVIEVDGLFLFIYLLRCFGFPVGFGLPPKSARAFGGNPVCCVNTFPPCGLPAFGLLAATCAGFPTRF
jgi:hypothetical protein